MFEKNENKTNLKKIPGIGKSMEKDLLDLGIKKISDLKGKDPETMYSDLIKLRKSYIDRCVLYVFRCAVYYSENKIREPELLKWWNWKDKK